MRKTCTFIALCVLGVSALHAYASPIRITSSQLNDFGPVWHPGSGTIAYVKEDGASKWQIGGVQSNGTNEQTLGTGPGSGYYGYSFALSWVGSTSEILTHERWVYHETLALNTNLAPFNRVISDGTDAANTRKLVVPGGRGGGLNVVSRDGSTILWRDSDNSTSPTAATLRTASYASLAGQGTNAHGTVALIGSNAIGIRGAALTPNGSQFIVSLATGALGGWDLFKYNSDGTGLVQRLTNSGETSGLMNQAPDISPDGSKILFQQGVYNVAGSYDVYMMNINGSNLAQITHTPGIDDGGPSWAPDGVRYTYNRYDTNLAGGEPDNWNVYVDVVPEPATLSLLALGGLALLRRRR